MSEQPAPVYTLDDYPRGSRLDDDTQLDFRASELVGYGSEQHQQIREQEAARQAVAAASHYEKTVVAHEIMEVAQLLSNLAATRTAAIDGKIPITPAHGTRFFDMYRKGTGKVA